METNNRTWTDLRQKVTEEKDERPHLLETSSWTILLSAFGSRDEKNLIASATKAYIVNTLGSENFLEQYILGSFNRSK